VYFVFVEATLTELRRDTSRVMRAANKGGDVILTEHGSPAYKIKRLRKADRRALVELIRSMGPIDLPPRK
jgi:prevent-host-death family protein